MATERMKPLIDMGHQERNIRMTRYLQEAMRHFTFVEFGEEWGISSWNRSHRGFEITFDSPHSGKITFSVSTQYPNA